MNLQNLLNSRRAGIFVLAVCRRLPPRLGCRLADSVADWICSNRETPMLQAIRANQWVISQGTLSSSQLDQAVREVMRNLARSFYNLFHYQSNPSALQNLVEESPAIERVIQLNLERKTGVIVSGVHMGSFDLVFQGFAQAAVARGARLIGLAPPQRTDAMKWQDEFRRQSGVDLLPANLVNLRKVLRRLKAGETIITGVDRPMDEVKYQPRFFGRQAHVPVHYIKLALKARAPMIVMTSIVRPNGRCQILSSDLLEMQSHPDRDTEILQNTERVLDIAADFIRQAPQQWAIFQPVWPESMAEVPK